MTDPIAALRKEHSNISQLLDVLQRQVDAFERGDRPDYDVIEAVSDYFLSYPDLYHHPKEDLVFEKLRKRDPEAAEQVGNLREEHEQIAALSRNFANGVRAILDEAEVPRDAFGTWAGEFITFQREHLAKEERVFFAAALRALTPDDWADIAARISNHEDPLFDAASGGRYDALRRDILTWASESEA